MAEKMIEPPESGVQFVTITNVHFTDRHRKLNRTQQMILSWFATPPDHSDGAYRVNHRVFPHLLGEGLQIFLELLSPPRPFPPALPDLNRECQISVGAAGPQPDARENVRQNARINLPVYTSRWYVRNYVRIVFQGGDHSKFDEPKKHIQI